MDIIYLILLLLSALLLGLAALPSPPPTKSNLVAAGLFCFVLVFVIKAALGLPG
jgi:hypothetical protein